VGAQRNRAPLKRDVSLKLLSMELPQSKTDYCVWIIAVLIIVSALTKIRLLLRLPNYQQLWEQILIIVFFVSALVSFGGLLFQKKWGFFFVYIYLIIATFFLSISVVPFLLEGLDLDFEPATSLLLIINLAVLASTAVIHAYKGKS
jgi:hypothetical protein